LKLQITIDGRAYAVDVEVLEDEENEESASEPPYQAQSLPAGQTLKPHSRVRHAAGRGQGGWSADGKVCHSPVMGLVIEVHVEPGQAVEEGALVLVLEAMKMQTNVTAPAAGTVKAVHVNAGESVKVGQVLVEFECAD